MNALEAARRAYEISLCGAARRDPLVQAVMARFPGSEIVDVRVPLEFGKFVETADAR